MTRRTRSVVIALGVVAALVAAEAGLTFWKGSEACVEVVNLGAEPIEDLVVASGGDRTDPRSVPPGGRTRFYLAGRGNDGLALTYRQKGNANGSYSLPGFDAYGASHGGYKTVLRIRPNEVERENAPADPATPLGDLVRNLWRSLLAAAGLEPDGDGGED